MNRRIKNALAILLALILAFALPLTQAIAATPQPQTHTPQASPSGSLTATPTASTVLVNGSSVSFDAYNIGGNNYFKLRDLAFALNGSIKQFFVGWDAENNAISLISGRPYIPVGGEMAQGSEGTKTPAPTRSTLYLNGREIQLTAYNISGNNYFKLRDIGLTLNIAVDWDASRNTIVVDTSRRYKDDAGAFSYSDSYYGAAQGSAKTLKGRSVLVSIFASGTTSWNEADISKAAQNLALATSWIEAEGRRYGVDIELVSDFAANPDLMYKMAYNGAVYAHADEKTDEDDQVSAETNRHAYQFIEDNVDYAALADKYGTDSIGYLVFYKDIEGRSYVFTYEAETKFLNERYHEKAMILGLSYKEPSVIAHEILHLFGAVDLYISNVYHGVSDAMVDFAQSNYGDDIMRGGRSNDSSGNVMFDAIQKSYAVTDISAYMLCWIDDIPELAQFPEYRREIPGAYIGKLFFYEGFHVWDYYSGSTYEGNWANGQKTGQGTFKWPNGDVYVGSFKNDVMSGRGTYTWPNGNVYTGDFENDVMSGRGTYTWSNENVYSGEFADGLMSGQGTFTWSNGDIYTGGWANDLRSGHGVLTFAAGQIYDGNWENGRKNGQGIYSWPSGAVYSGSFENDVMHGHGTYTWPNGALYVGGWAYDVRSGYGVMTFADGTVQEGVWADNSFVG